MCYRITGKLSHFTTTIILYYFYRKNILNSCKSLEILNKYSAIHLNTLCSKTMEQHVLDTNAGKQLS